jgi:hypothetical protein
VDGHRIAIAEDAPSSVIFAHDAREERQRECRLHGGQRLHVRL